MFYKAARVEYYPLGVVGAIVPWNYPFHNLFNPLSAALFAGNAIVIKVGMLLLLRRRMQLLQSMCPSLAGNDCGNADTFVACARA